MDKRPAVSVIVPVYKAENYLCRCVDSLLSQTFGDYEILLIDDGSPDFSGELCDQYAEKDHRVRAFHKTNGGVSSARQFGLDHARGEYVIHADPDDWMEPDMLDALYKKAKNEDADMVICDFYEECNGKQKYIKQQPLRMNHESVLGELFHNLHSSCWNKLIKRESIVKYAVSFPEGVDLCEDLVFMVRLLRNQVAIAYLPIAFYHYDRSINGNAITKSGFRQIYSQRKLMLQYLDNSLDHSEWRPYYDLMFTRLAIEIFVFRYYTPSQFFQQYFRDRSLLFRMAPMKWKFFIYLSAVGFFYPMWSLYRLLRIIK